MNKWLSKLSLISAVIFIIIAIACVITSFSCIFLADTYVGISSTFATLASAILVFSTLEIQHQLLKEEIRKNECSRFDSRFYPILSSFRMDAANMEISRDYIIQKGKRIGCESSLTFKGDQAFFIAREIIENLIESMGNNSLDEYCAEDIKDELTRINEIENYLDENCMPEKEIEKVIDERTRFLRLKQVPYLLYKYGISKNIRLQYKKAERDVMLSFLLGKILLIQPTIFAKYIQSLRFILHTIDALPKEIDKNNYYQNISCLLGKEERLFLGCFKEFDKITKIK